MFVDINTVMEDSNIIILMRLDPKTRTEFLRSTHVPGLKTKLRQFAKQMVYTPQVIENFSDLEFFTTLMKYGGVPPQQVIEKLPEEWEYEPTTRQDEKKICNRFLNMYFDCGFLFVPHLSGILSHCDHSDFDLFFTLYKQLIKFNPEDSEHFLLDFATGEQIYSLQNNRYEFWTYQLEVKRMSPKLLKLYLTFDLNHFKLDSCHILEIVRRGVESDPQHYSYYFEAVLEVPYPQTNLDINKSLKRFFGHLVNKAVYDTENCTYYRKILEKHNQFYGYMASSLFAIHKVVTMKIEWVDAMMKNLMSNPKDLAFAFLLDHYTF